MTTLRTDLNKVSRTILSCKNKQQLKLAQRMVDNFKTRYGIVDNSKDICICPKGSTEETVTIHFVNRSLDSAMRIVNAKLTQASADGYHIEEQEFEADFSKFIEPETNIGKGGSYDFFIPDNITIK